MRDPCQSDLVRTPHCTAAAGWLWTQQNPPASPDEYLSGKWMLFPLCEQAVPAWRAVAQAARAGQIWQAKIAPQATSNGHLICVYTPDFTDQPGVETVAVLLDDLGLAQRRLYYKPDIFTYAGIYNSSARRKERASIYEYLPGQRRIELDAAALNRARQLLAATTGPTAPQLDPDVVSNRLPQIPG